MRLAALLIALASSVCGSVCHAQTDTVSSSLLQEEVAPSCACHSFTLRQTIAPAVLLTGAGIVRHWDKDVKQFRDDYLFGFDNRFDDVLQVTPGILLLSLRAFGVEGRSRTWGQLLSASGFSALITAGVTEGMKNTWGRTRPYRVWYHNSFPSGHTFSAFTSATLLHREYGQRSPWFSIGGYTVASAVGVSRILNRDHWASDVLAGAGLGLVSGNLGYGLAECLFQNPRKGTPTFIGRTPSFLALNAVVVPFGNDIPSLNSTAETPLLEKEHVRFLHRAGIGYSIEGAYFPWRHLGIGCETTLHYNYYRMDEDHFFSPQNPYAYLFGSFSTKGRTTTYMLLPGLYAAVPISNRCLLGGKVLYGMGQTFSFNVDASAASGVVAQWPYLYDDFTYGSAFKAGLHTRYLLTKYLELKAEVDYSRTSAGVSFYGYEHCTNGMRNLSLQVGAAVSLQ